MKYIKIVTITTITGFFLTACTPANSYIYQDINFGVDRNVDFKQGVQDACLTASGSYKKDSYMFKNNESYRVGWKSGRLKCK